MHRIFGFFLCLLTLFIPIERSIDKAFRKISSQWIPEGLNLPGWYDQKISLYLTDLAVIALLIYVLFVFREPILKLLFAKENAWLMALFFFIALSIVLSPFAANPVSYAGLLQLLTPFLLYFMVARFGRDWTRPILWCFVAMGCFEAIVAIAQYFLQHPLGLHQFGELRNLFYSGTIPSNGTRWLIDHWMGIEVQGASLFRSPGTLPHSNILAGFLLVSLFSLFGLVCETEKKKRLLPLIPLMIFAVFLTYCRSAIYGGLIAGLFFFVRVRAPKILYWTAIASIVLTFFLLNEQIVNRGGLVNYHSTLASLSDDVRFKHQNIALEMIKKHPYFGVGYQQFTYTSEFNDFSQKEPICLVHNSALLLAAESGLFALACLLGFFFFFVRNVFSLSRSPIGGACLSIFIAYLFISGCDFYPFVFHQSKFSLFLILGILSCQKAEVFHPVAAY